MSYTYTLKEKATLPRSTFDTLMPWKGIRRCLLNYDGTVNYYLDPNDSTKKADGSPATLDSTEGNVMVEIPKFYYKIEYQSGQYNWYISDGPQTGFNVHPAFLRDRDGAGLKEVDKIYVGAFKATYEPTYRFFSVINNYSPTGSNGVNMLSNVQSLLTSLNGPGWKVMGWNELFAIQLLYLIEYQSFDCQANLGKGITAPPASMTNGVNGSGSTTGYKPGYTVKYGNKSTSIKDEHQEEGSYSISYRGIEDLYSSMGEYLDGINVALKDSKFPNGSITIDHEKQNRATDIKTFSTSCTVPTGYTNGTIKDFERNQDLGFFPTDFSGAKGEGIQQSLDFSPSYGNSNSNIMLYGFLDYGMPAGLFTYKIRSKDWSNTTYRLVY